MDERKPQPGDRVRVGEVRREDHEAGFGHSIWQVEENEDGHQFWRCTHSSAPGNRGTTLPLANARGWPVIGAVPGTPAAEAQSMVNAASLFPPPAGTTPRVFRSDGPEPPADVRAVHSVMDPDLPYPYFVRHGDGWALSSDPDGQLDPDVATTTWDRTYCYGIGSEFREVRS